MVRILERGIRCVKVTEIPVVASIVWNLIEDDRRTSLQRTLHISHGGNGLVFDGHGRSSVTRLSETVSNHECHRITDMSYFALCKSRMWRFLHRHTALSGDAPSARNATNAVALEIF